MKIAIIGGGIAGLTTGLALAKLGMDSIIYEKAETLNEIGAGIWLQPNAMKVLQWLGIANKIRQHGCTLNNMEITYPNLVPVKKIAEETVEDDSLRTVAIHRGVLQKILHEALRENTKLVLDKSFNSLAAAGEDLQLNFNNYQATYDLLIGADGIHSRVRSHVVTESELRNSGQYCWRGIAHYTLPQPLQNMGKEAWGKGIRFGFSALSNDSVYWFAVANYKPSLENYKPTELANLFQSFHPVVNELIRNTTAIHTTTLQDLKRLPHWQNGKNICLIGDAAHATSPNMGQGAGQGIEDAYYLSNQLNQQKPLDEALKQFESQRRKKVDYVVNTSWQLGKMAHNPLTQSILKGMMKLTPQSTIKKQMAKLYAVDRL